jgi:hypothetical protein
VPIKSASNVYLETHWLIVVAKSPNQDPNKKEHANETCPAIAQLGTWLPHSIYLPWRKIGPHLEFTWTLAGIVAAFSWNKKHTAELSWLRFCRASKPTHPVTLLQRTGSRVSTHRAKNAVQDPGPVSWVVGGHGHRRTALCMRSAHVRSRPERVWKVRDGRTKGGKPPLALSILIFNFLFFMMKISYNFLASWSTKFANITKLCSVPFEKKMYPRSIVFFLKLENKNLIPWTLKNHLKYLLWLVILKMVSFFEVK